MRLKSETKVVNLKTGEVHGEIVGEGEVRRVLEQATRKFKPYFDRIEREQRPTAELMNTILY